MQSLEYKPQPKPGPVNFFRYLSYCPHCDDQTLQLITETVKGLECSTHTCQSCHKAVISPKNYPLTREFLTSPKRIMFAISCLLLEAQHPLTSLEIYNLVLNGRSTKIPPNIFQDTMSDIAKMDDLEFRRNLVVGSHVQVWYFKTWRKEGHFTWQIQKNWDTAKRAKRSYLRMLI